MANTNGNARQSIDDQNVYIRDTLMSIASSYAETLKDAVGSAFDSAEAGTLSAVGKDLARTFTQLAKMSDEFALNQGRINAGILTERDVAKQLQSIAEKREGLERKMLHAKQLGIEFSEEDYQAALKSLDVQEQLLEGDRESVKLIEEKIGLTGKLVSSIAKIPGIGKFLKADEINQEMRKAAAQGANKFQTMGVAAKMVGKQLLDGLLDPLAFITFILDGFMKVDKAATDFTRITGQGSSAISSMNSELASTVDILEVASGLSKEIGIAANNFISPQQLAAVAETKNLLGLSAEQATQLAIQTKLSGQNVDLYKKNVMAGVKQSNLQNKSGVEYGVVIQDILSTSEDVTMALGNNPQKLAAAATAARSFGLTLQQVDTIAKSLLNFEDSISAELEAELLTGKQLNLEKAREYALTNNLEGLANELAKNGASAAEYSKMNRLEQESLAKSLGMSREQLAKSVLAQEASKSLTDKQRAAVMGMTEAEYERVSIQERMQKSLDKIAQAFAPILEKFIVPIAEVLTKILNLPLVPYILAAVVAARALGMSFGGIFKSVGGVVGNIGGLKDKIMGAAGGLKDKLMGGGADKAKEAAEKAGTAKDKVVGKEGGTGFKDSMKNLAGGLKAMGAEGVGKGVFNLAMAGPALVVALPSIPFLLFMGKAGLSSLYKNFSALARGLSAMSGTLMGSVALGVFGIAAIPAVASIPFLLFMGKVDLKSLTSNFTALATGLTAMSGTFVGSLALAAFGVAGLIAIPSLIFLGGIALIGAAASVGLTGLATGLTALGTAAATGLPFLAIALIGALGIAMIPFGIALGFAAPAIQAFGTVITSVFAGLATVIPVIANGFVTLMGAVTMENIGPMLLLGPALFGIAAGLGAIALAGPLAIPALIAVTGLAAVVGGVATIFGGGGGDSIGTSKGKSEEGSMAGVEQKLDALIAAVKAGGNVYMDSNKVGRAQMLGSFKSA